VIDMVKIGISDTTFSRVDMGAIAISKLNKISDYSFERYTVPGIKDLPVACNILFKKYNCDIVIALGMAGPKLIDKQCSHEASLGLQTVQIQNLKHILEVFVHMDEAKSEIELFGITKNRIEKHVLNAIELLKGKDALSKCAGMGKRQGKEDEGPIKL